MARRLRPKDLDVSETGLLEQIRLLKIENETLRAFIAEKGFSAALPKPTDGPAENRMPTKSNKSPSVPHTPYTPGLKKGCSCKGNCSTKVCGCVKKNIPCAEFCRCGDDVCQNSEPDKENIGDPNKPQLSKDDEDSLTKLSTLTLTESKESKNKLVNKRLEKIMKPRSIFSPEPTNEVFTFEEALGEVEFENLSLRFGEDKETDAGTSAEKDVKVSGTKGEAAKKSKKKNASKTKNTETAKKQDNPLDLLPSNEATNEHIEPDPSITKKKTEPTNKGKKKAEKAKTNTGTGKRNNLIDLEKKDESASQKNEYLQSNSEPSNKNKKETEKNAVRNNRIDTESEDKAIEEEQDSESEYEHVVKNKKVDKKEVAKRVTRKRNNRKVAEDDSESEEPFVRRAIAVSKSHVNRIGSEGVDEAHRSSEDSESELEPEIKRKQVIPAIATSEPEEPVEMGESSSKNGDNRKKTENRGEKDVETAEIDKKNNQKSATEAGETFQDRDHFDLKPAGSNTSSNHAAGSNEETDDFNPMKPRRQLSRSPVAKHVESRPVRVLDPSEMLLPIPLVEEPEEELPPPPELEKDIVDNWAEHEAILVPCRKCKRTFHPHRIKKHEASCQKI